MEQGTWGDASIPLQDLERLRTDLLSIIAHELRTPITVMRTLTGLLLDPASHPTDEQRRTMLETMERNAERMQHLIDEILDLARYRSGTIGLQLRQFDAAELAFVVQDDWQGKGLGTWLVRELLRAAELNGLRRFRAYVLGENRRMLRLLDRYAEITERRVDQGVVELSLVSRPGRTPDAPPGSEQRAAR